MKEYIPREDALNFETKITAAPSDIQAISQGMALYAEHIKAIPAADVVEVVRCRDCAHFKQFIGRPDGTCDEPNIDTLPFGDDFCIWGRRKE